MPTADERLAKIRLKIERAKHHVCDLEAKIQIFRNGNPYGTRINDDPETGDKIHRLQIRRPIPDDFALIAGDAIHNLRSALDHLAWQLVEANGQTPGKWTYFPISETAAKYKTECPGKVKGMSTGAVSLIDTVQPYQGGNDKFWELNCLDNIDKHRLLFVADFGFRDISTIIVFPDDSWQTIGREGMRAGFPFEILQDGDVIGRVAPGWVGKGDVQLKPGFEIAFAEPQIVKGKPVVPLLTNLSQVVESVVNQFLPVL